MPEIKGIIKDRKYATQIRDFSGLQFGTITPTDIDALIDFHNQAFILIEFKYDGTSLLDGQRLALERLIDIISDSGRFGLLIIAEHITDADINCGNCIVREYRWKRKWHEQQELLTVREILDKFLAKHHIF